LRQLRRCGADPCGFRRALLRRFARRHREWGAEGPGLIRGGWGREEARGSGESAAQTLSPGGGDSGGRPPPHPPPHHRPRHHPPPSPPPDLRPPSPSKRPPRISDSRTGSGSIPTSGRGEESVRRGRFSTRSGRRPRLQLKERKGRACEPSKAIRPALDPRDHPVARRPGHALKPVRPANHRHPPLLVQPAPRRHSQFSLVAGDRI